MQAMLHTYIVTYMYIARGALVYVCRCRERGSRKNVHTQRLNDAKLVGIFVRCHSFKISVCRVLG